MSTVAEVPKCRTGFMLVFVVCNWSVVIDRVLSPVIIKTRKPDDDHEYHESYVST